MAPVAPHKEAHQKNDNPNNQTQSEHPPATSRLMNLPAELRNRIYEAAVVKATPIEIVQEVQFGHRSFSHRSRPKISKDVHPPALARVSRQLRWEVLAIFYAENVFTFPLRSCILGVDGKKEEKLVCGWLASLSEDCRKSLGSPVIRSDVDSTSQFMQRSLTYSAAGSRTVSGSDVQLAHKPLDSNADLRDWCWIGNIDLEATCKGAAVWFRKQRPSDVYHQLILKSDESIGAN